MIFRKLCCVLRIVIYTSAAVHWLLFMKIFSNDPEFSFCLFFFIFIPFVLWVESRAPGMLSVFPTTELYLQPPLFFKNISSVIASKAGQSTVLFGSRIFKTNFYHFLPETSKPGHSDLWALPILGWDLTSVRSDFQPSVWRLLVGCLLGKVALWQFVFSVRLLHGRDLFNRAFRLLFLTYSSFLNLWWLNICALGIHFSGCLHLGLSHNCLWQRFLCRAVTVLFWWVLCGCLRAVSELCLSLGHFIRHQAKSSSDQ